MRDSPTIEYAPRVCPDGVASCVRTFWQQLFDRESGTLNLVSGFLVGSRLHGITRKSFSWPQDSELAASWVAHEAVLGRDLYQDGFLGSGKKGRPLYVSSLFGELHADDLGDFPQPSIVVELAPGLFQCYWKLTESIPFATARKMMSRFRWECDHPMRIPGTPNHRYHGGPVMKVTRSGAESYSASQLVDGLSVGPETIRESVEPVPAFGTDLRGNLGVIGVRAAVGGAVAVVAMLGGFAVPDAISEPTANLGAVSASFGFNEIRSAVFASPARVAGKPVVFPAPRAVKAKVLPTVSAEGVRARHGRVAKVREFAADFVETADGIPVQAVMLANQARELWTGAAESAWNVP